MILRTYPTVIILYDKYHSVRSSVEIYKLHAREFSRQKVEAMIGSGILNKMTSLGMPQSYRCA